MCRYEKIVTFLAVSAAALFASRDSVVAGVVIDLGHGYTPATTCWFPYDRFETYDVKVIMNDVGLTVNVESFKVAEHCGTHLDAPYHFTNDGWKVGDIPLDRMIAEGVHVNVSSEVNGNADFLLTAEHLKAWERDNGPLPHRSVILVNFGWAHKFGDRKSYFNSPNRFPGLGGDAAQWIADSGKVYGVGVDVPSIDQGASTKFEAHVILAKAGLYNLENVALNGTVLPPRGFKLVVQPIKIVGGTGGPARILAFTKNAFE